MAKSELVVGLDIGTTKICAVVGELSDNDTMDIIGIGLSPSTGLRKGVVVNIDQTVKSIKQAISEAEHMAGCEISSVYAGIAGSHISGLNSDGVIAIKGGEVTQKDIERVLEAARAIAIPMDREVIHTLPQEYIVDDQCDILDPLGMSGVRLEAKVHIVTGAVASGQNIIRSCHKANLDVSDIVLEALASSKAILTREEREIGVAIVDIGGGTSDVAVFTADAIRYTGVVALGGRNLTKDIAFGLRTSEEEAEKIKLKHACALVSDVHPDEYIDVQGVGGREPSRLPKALLAEICEPRMEEILSLANQELEKSGFKGQIGAGVVLTGGTSLIRNCQELAEQIFGLPVRIGAPINVGGIKDLVDNPKYATAVGLLRYGAEKENSPEDFGVEHNVSTTSFGKIYNNIKRWLSEIL